MGWKELWRRNRGKQRNCTERCFAVLSPTLGICRKRSKKKDHPISAEVGMVPTTVPLNDVQAEDVDKLIEKLEQDDDDVQKVFHNMG